MPRRSLIASLFFLLFCGCGTSSPPPAKPHLTIAAASNLSPAFDEIGREFTAATGIEVTFSYGATAVLAKQIESGAPFDAFAAADTQHVDTLVTSGVLRPESRAIFARGQLVLWIPKGPGNGIATLQDLAKPKARFIAIAQPDLAPYGAAAVESLKAAKLWDAVQPKLVYANSISQAKQYAATGNAEAAFTALSLVQGTVDGLIVTVDPSLYTPLDHAWGIVMASPHQSEITRFAEFLQGERSRAILTRRGYQFPETRATLDQKRRRK